MKARYRIWSRILSALVPLEVLETVVRRSSDRMFQRTSAKFEYWGGNGSRISYPWNALVGCGSIRIGQRVHINKGLFLGAYGPADRRGQIVIGDDVVINYDCQVTACNSVTIGKGVLMGSRVLVTDHGHGDVSPEALALPPMERELVSKGPVVIGDHCWIGSGVAILPGVTLGESSVVGANAVVTRSFPPRSVIGGNPARLIRSV
uniref:SpaU n=1 Tax=Spirochaeta aurantia TaxID=147 RepID=Q0PHY5_SPIAU|nr:SpaU [Spirochaeta aurantia]